MNSQHFDNDQQQELQQERAAVMNGNNIGNSAALSNKQQTLQEQLRQMSLPSSSSFGGTTTGKNLHPPAFVPPSPMMMSEATTTATNNNNNSIPVLTTSTPGARYSNYCNAGQNTYAPLTGRQVGLASRGMNNHEQQQQVYDGSTMNMMMNRVGGPSSLNTNNNSTPFQTWMHRQHAMMMNGGDTHQELRRIFQQHQQQRMMQVQMNAASLVNPASERNMAFLPNRQQQHQQQHHGAAVAGVPTNGSNNNSFQSYNVQGCVDTNNDSANNGGRFNVEHRFVMQPNGGDPNENVMASLSFNTDSILPSGGSGGGMVPSSFYSGRGNNNVSYWNEPNNSTMVAEAAVARMRQEERSTNLNDNQQNFTIQLPNQPTNTDETEDSSSMYNNQEDMPSIFRTLTQEQQRQLQQQQQVRIIDSNGQEYVLQAVNYRDTSIDQQQQATSASLIQRQHFHEDDRSFSSEEEKKDDNNYKDNIPSSSSTAAEGLNNLYASSDVCQSSAAACQYKNNEDSIDRKKDFPNINSTVGTSYGNHDDMEVTAPGKSVSRDDDEYEAARLLHFFHEHSPAERCITNFEMDPNNEKQGNESTVKTVVDQSVRKHSVVIKKSHNDTNKRRGRPPKEALKKKKVDVSVLENLQNEVPPWEKLIKENNKLVKIDDRDGLILLEGDDENNSIDYMAAQTSSKERCQQVRARVDPSFDSLFIALAQMVPCQLTEDDRNGGITSYKQLPLNFTGLGCRYCGGRPGSGRYFPGSVRSLSQTTTAQNMIKHFVNASVVVQEDEAREYDSDDGDQCGKPKQKAKVSHKAFCTNCPYPVWLWLRELQRRLSEGPDDGPKGHEREEDNKDGREIQRVRYGARKILYSLVWKRMQENGTRPFNHSRDEIMHDEDRVEDDGTRTTASMEDSYFSYQDYDETYFQQQHMDGSKSETKRKGFDTQSKASKVGKVTLKSSSQSKKTKLTPPDS